MLQQMMTLWDTCCRSPAHLRPDRSPEDTDDTPPPGRNCQQDKRLETEKLDWVTGQTDDCRDGGETPLTELQVKAHLCVFYSDISHEDQTWLKLWCLYRKPQTKGTKVWVKEIPHSPHSETLCGPESGCLSWTETHHSPRRHCPDGNHGNSRSSV